MKKNTKKLLLVAVVSTLLVTGCGDVEETIVDDTSVDAVGYEDNATNLSDVELNSTPTGTKEQAEGEAAADSAADMVNSMKKTLDSMSDTVVDTVDTIKKGTTETIDDVGSNIKRGTAETQKDITDALENMKKSEGAEISGSGDDGEAEMLDADDDNDEDEVDL